MKKLFFSVVIPTLNEEKWVGGLLSNLVDQNFEDFEVIVVDAKSDDKTGKVVGGFRNKIKNIRLKTSTKRNVSYQRNLGASFAKGKYLLFIDADSRIPSDFLEKESEQLKSGKTDLFSNWFLSTQEAVIYRLYGLIGSIAYWLADKVSLPAAPGTLMGVERMTFRKLNGFSETIQFAEDRELVRRSVKNGYNFSFFEKPKYFMSLRRIEKRGIAKFLLMYVWVNIKRQLGINVDRKKEYPMGGKYD